MLTLILSITGTCTGVAGLLLGLANYRTGAHAHALKEVLFKTQLANRIYQEVNSSDHFRLWEAVTELHRSIELVKCYLKKPWLFRPDKQQLLTEWKLSVRVELLKLLENNDLDPDLNIVVQALYQVDKKKGDNADTVRRQWLFVQHYFRTGEVL